MSPGFAQELEPRRWTHLPIDTNFFGGGYAYTEASIAFDPVLHIENATLEMHTWAARFIRTFEVFDRSARIEFGQAWHEGYWAGLLDGVPTTVQRTGFSDSVVRLAVNLVGAPPLAGKDYSAYRKATDSETLVGAALSVQLPTGQYKKNKLINLGSNRFTFRPQLGILHNRGRWSFELTGAAWVFTDNDSFFNGNRLEQDPLYALQGHAVHTFPSGLWLALGAGYGFGGQSMINGVKKNDRKENVAWTIGAGYPVTSRLNFTATYFGNRQQTAVGADSETFSVGLSAFW
jgi:hypothetical protein